MTNQGTQVMTDVKTFRAESMREALRIVKAAMGPEAVILHTRQIPGKRLLPWQNAPDEVEITAGVGVDGSPANPTSRPHSQNVVPDPNTKRFAAQAAVPGDPGVRVELSKPPRPHQMSAVSQSQPQLARQHKPQVQGAAAEPSVAELAEQIASIQQMLQQLGLKNNETETPVAAGTQEAPAPLPASLENLQENLRENEIPEDITKGLLSQLQAELTPEQLDDPAATNAMLTAMIKRRVATTGPIQLQSGERKVVALVGATGVGKTTTIAKLAANFRLREHVKMGLVTVDTYRIAAVEQLRTYAEIIDLPMKVVTNPLEMRRALDELVGLDLVLIDTAGRSPRDELQIQELRRLLAEARVDEVHLVLSMTSNLRSLIASAEKFAQANATSLVLTKLDEAMGLGNLLELTRKVPLPISYLTTGQDVPNDIEPADSDRIARLLLGRESIPN